jgi:hypothetical protein
MRSMKTRHRIPGDERLRAVAVALFERMAYVSTLITLRLWSPPSDGIWLVRPAEPIFYRPPTPTPEDCYAAELLEYWGDELNYTK